MTDHDLEAIAQALVKEGKGILAADESFGTIAKRFKKIGVDSTEENRRSYREMLFTTQGMEDYISGVILFDETIHQKTQDGVPFPELLHSKGVIPGIKVDEGKVDIPFFPGEQVTIGLDGLEGRLHEYYDLGARFTKWRAVINIGENLPTDYAIRANAQALARMAALSQQAGLAPIVEPEVLMDGDHSIETCEAVTTQTLITLYQELSAARIKLEGSLLKPNMVLPGKACPVQVSDKEIAEATIRTLKRAVPAAVPGVVFLSGGMSAEAASARLSAMNQMGPHPWQLGFSYGRALQEPSLNAWKGEEANVPTAQSLFRHRAHMNGLARRGEYREALDAESIK
jgi:fructose-bisphosphate aldolase, class I